MNSGFSVDRDTKMAVSLSPTQYYSFHVGHMIETSLMYTQSKLKLQEII